MTRQSTIIKEMIKNDEPKPNEIEGAKSIKLTIKGGGAFCPPFYALKKETTLLPFIHSLPSKRHRPSSIHST